MAGPPFPRQKVAIYCCLAYLSTHCTIPGPERCAGRKARHSSYRPPIGLIQISVDASCWAAPGDVLRLPGDAAVAIQCHFLHRLHTHPNGSPHQHAPPMPPRKI
eukprot:1149738-Pelagomonas_calceolata.AAC.1